MYTRYRKTKATMHFSFNQIKYSYTRQLLIRLVHALSKFGAVRARTRANQIPRAKRAGKNYWIICNSAADCQILLKFGSSYTVHYWFAELADLLTL